MLVVEPAWFAEGQNRSRGVARPALRGEPPLEFDICRLAKRKLTGYR
jgi:hypothetical protein